MTYQRICTLCAVLCLALLSSTANAGHPLGGGSSFSISNPFKSSKSKKSSKSTEAKRGKTPKLPGLKGFPGMPGLPDGCPAAKGGKCKAVNKPVICGPSNCKYSNSCKAKLAGFKVKKQCKSAGKAKPNKGKPKGFPGLDLPGLPGLPGDSMCQVTSSTGGWEYLATSTGKDYTITYTAENTRSKEGSKGWSQAAQESVFQKFGVKGNDEDVGKSCRYDAAKTVSNALAKDDNRNYSQTFNTKGAIWQYTIEMKDKCVKKWEVTTKDVLLTPARNKPPCCLPGKFFDNDKPHGPCTKGSPCMCSKDVCEAKEEPDGNDEEAPRGGPSNGKPAKKECPAATGGRCTAVFEPVTCGDSNCKYSNSCKAKLAGFNVKKQCTSAENPPKGGPSHGKPNNDKGGDGKTCKPGKREVCSTARCGAPPKGCKYVNDQYVLGPSGACCPKRCYAVDKYGNKCGRKGKNDSGDEGGKDDSDEELKFDEEKPKKSGKGPKRGKKDDDSDEELGYDEENHYMRGYMEGFMHGKGDASEGAGMDGMIGTKAVLDLDGGGGGDDDFGLYGDDDYGLGGGDDYYYQDDDDDDDDSDSSGDRNGSGSGTDAIVSLNINQENINNNGQSQNGHNRKLRGSA